MSNMVWYNMVLHIVLYCIADQISSNACIWWQARRQGGAMGANAPPPPPRAEKVRLEGSKDELTKKKNAKDEAFLLIYQSTQLFTVQKTYPRLLIT